MSANEDQNINSSPLLDQGRVALTVNTGVCRFPARVECWIEDGLLRCSIESGCPYVQEFGAALGPLSIMDVMKMPYSENVVYIVGGRTLKHSTCPMPMAVLKGLEVAAGLALRGEVTVTFEK